MQNRASKNSNSKPHSKSQSKIKHHEWNEYFKSVPQFSFVLPITKECAKQYCDLFTQMTSLQRLFFYYEIWLPAKKGLSLKKKLEMSRNGPAHLLYNYYGRIQYNYLKHQKDPNSAALREGLSSLFTQEYLKQNAEQVKNYINNPLNLSPELLQLIRAAQERKITLNNHVNEETTSTITTITEKMGTDITSSDTEGHSEDDKEQHKEGWSAEEYQDHDEDYISEEYSADELKKEYKKEGEEDLYKEPQKSPPPPFILPDFQSTYLHQLPASFFGKRKLEQLQQSKNQKNKKFESDTGTENNTNSTIIAPIPVRTQKL